MKKTLFLLIGVGFISLSNALIDGLTDDKSSDQEPTNSLHDKLNIALDKEFTSEEFNRILEMIKLIQRLSPKDSKDEFDLKNIIFKFKSKEDISDILNFILQVIKSVSEKQKSFFIDS